MLYLAVAIQGLLGANALTTGRSSRIEMSGVTRNANMGKLQAGYLFPEIGKRRNAFLAENPDAKIISLGIGDTTLPVPDHILTGLRNGVNNLGAKETYTGYGAEQGVGALRAKISEALYGGRISPEEVFVSDGSKCDIGRLQMMFGNQVKSAVQDPSYPVYVDTSVMMGQTQTMDAESKQYDGIVYMKCGPENGFFPDLEKAERADVVYFCSPNNPTGAAATREQLEQLVAWAKERGSIIVFDAAYAPFIRSKDVPKSIYEIEGAEECAIEVNSLSKYAGFTGVRLGWTIVPKALKFKDGTPVANDYNRVMCTAFNGASNIVQAGALAALEPEGLAEIEKLIDYYMGNAKMLLDTMLDLGFKVHGGIDAPYVFVDLEGKSSWDMFSELLETAQVVTIPGAGFGPGGEGFLRLSAFAPREACEEACTRLRKAMAKE
jgi:LL-diaminopimelate aminotransferase